MTTTTSTPSTVKVCRAVKDNREIPATPKFLRGWVWAANRDEYIAKAMDRWPDLDPTQIRS